MIVSIFFSYLCVQNSLKYFLKIVLIQMNLVLPAKKKLHCDLLALENIGGFQLEFVSISQVINQMTCYKFSALFG